MIDAPGLIGLLQFVGIDWLVAIAEAVFGIAILGLFFISIENAMGTFMVREHVSDMLPWMILFPFFIVAIRGAS